MPGGKGKSTGGKAGPKAAEGKSQKSHSAKAGLQVSDCSSSFSRLREDPEYQELRVDHNLHTRDVLEPLKIRFFGSLEISFLRNR